VTGTQVPVAFSVASGVVMTSPAFCRLDHSARESPAPNPGNVAAKATAQIDCGLMHRQLRGSGPKLKLVTMAVAAMAKVAADCHVHGERATTPRRGFMQRTRAVPLHARSIRGLEPKQVQNLLHRDSSANSLEVDAWHGYSSGGDSTSRRCFDRSVPLLSMGNGNDLLS
jgi:hypothetical protein